jgi:hypothetical protein
MEPIQLNNSEQIQQVLSKIVLTGSGFCTDCLLADVIDVGITYPDFFKAHGEDPDAQYDGKSPAWSTYHIRQGKRVFMVYGGDGKPRRTQFTETP